MKSNSYDDADVRSIVLVGIDFSGLAREVLATAAKLARSSGSELHVVHVLPNSADGAARGEGVLRLSNLADDIRARLAQLAAEVPDAVKRIDLHVRLGKPDVEIAQLASDINADLLVVGTHSQSTLDRLMLGSVAESLVRHATCPVLTYRSKSVPKWEQIAPSCVDCATVQRTTQRARLWCERHSQHHPRPHTYSDIPDSYAMGSQTFR
jgi:nucleotide-binding universal stress UspA family protein